MTPNLPTVLAVAGLVLWIVAQYGLIVLALRDLMRRPVVRGGNRVAWALAIVAIPFVGPLAYAAWHPGVLPAAPRRRPRVPRRGLPPRAVPADRLATAGTCPPEICPPEPAAEAGAVRARRKRGRRPLDRTERVR